ncbi:4'-phosphopantetheinyl transferase family protein [Sinorhizobium meliloti]|uniref:4'-phosphopantetheinyl transferase family protein n=1 Tax=Rhizobium meliloti TaxID=382 RepID=UPI003F15502C
MVIAQLVGCAPKTLRIEIEESGKPRLPDYPEIGFSLSYGSEAVILAISGTGPIGFDVEQIGTGAPSDDPHLPSLVLSATELLWFEGLRAPEQAKAFLSYWVKKEAVLKCLGAGLLQRPEEVTVAPPSTTRETISLPTGRFFLRSGTCSWHERNFQWAVATLEEPHDIAWRHYGELSEVALPKGFWVA